MDIIQSLKWRYATKKFDPERIIPLQKIEILKEAFNLTATSFGLQPLKLVIVHDKEKQKELIKYSWDQPQVYEASHLLVFAIEKTVDSSYIKNYFERVKQVRETPDSVLNPFMESLIESFAAMSDADIQTWAAKQAYLAMGNLLTVCAIEKIDACPMEGFIPEKYDEVMGLDKHNLSAALVMPIGYRAGDDMFSGFKKVRKELGDAIITL